MQKKHNRNNASSIFGVYQIPSTSQITNLLDPINPEHLYPVLVAVGDAIFSSGHLESSRAINQTLLIAMDGTDTFSSEKISCECCHTQTLKNCQTLYRHSAVTPVLVSPRSNRVIPLPPEFIQKQDGQEKQDCELAASKRWLNTWGAHYQPRRITILGDDLYCHQPFCQAILDQGMDFLLVCKPDSHSLVYEWIDDFTRIKKIQNLQVTKWNGKKRLTEHYRWCNQIPLRDSDDALMVNWCEVVILDEQQKNYYRNAWVTSHTITEQNVQEMVASGRTRWKIENENNNTLKNHGYHFEHNYGHGKLFLANFLKTLILLAFLMHTALEFLDELFHKAKNSGLSRRTFFEQLRTILQIMPFDNWQHFMLFIQDG